MGRLDARKLELEAMLRVAEARYDFLAAANVKKLSDEEFLEMGDRSLEVVRIRRKLEKCELAKVEMAKVLRRAEEAGEKEKEKEKEGTQG